MAHDEREAFARYLVPALDAEASKRWIESYTLCEQALVAWPEDPDALNLLGRLCAVAEDWPRAIALQSFVLHLDPQQPNVRADLANARRAVVSQEEARQLFERAVALEPDVTCHQRHTWSLLPFVGMERAEELLRQALLLDPSHADAHAALGNVLARRLQHLDAINAYGLAVMLRWDFAPAHLALANLLDAISEGDMARRHRVEALRVRRVFAACACSNDAKRRVLVLAAPGGAIENAPLDLVVNPTQTALHRYYLADGPPSELPPYDVIFNGIEEMESSADAIARAAAFVSAATVPVVNDPNRLIHTRRSNLAASLAGIAGCRVPDALRLTRSQLDQVSEIATDLCGTRFPVVVRPIDRHRGEGCERLSNAREVGGYVVRYPSEYYNVAPYVDYRSPDGYFRKYRVVVVDGRPFAYHLAISDRWMVHYVGSSMKDFEWMRHEEEAFLAAPSCVFERWNQTFGEIARALELDYFGVDCARMQNGETLVFECGTGMLVHCRDDADLFAYKYRYVPRIFDAVERMLDARTSGPAST